MADERFTALPTAEEITLFREAYAETYPVRLLLNAIDAKDAEIGRLREELTVARAISMGPIQHYVERLRSVALAAKALVQSAHDQGLVQSTLSPLATDDIETVVSNPALTALEFALEAAVYGMSEEEFERGIAEETTAVTPEFAAGFERGIVEQVINDVEALAGERTDTYWAAHVQACEEIRHRLKETWSALPADAKAGEEESSDAR